MRLFNDSFVSLRVKVLFRFTSAVLVFLSILFLSGSSSAPVVVAESLPVVEAVKEVATIALVPSSGNSDIDRFILDSASRHGVDPKLVYYVIRQESNFKLTARSGKNAQGLMQMIPATAERFGVKDAYDPQQNIEGGVKYLRWLLKRFNGDVRLALAGYNAGEGAVQKCGNQVPDYTETKNYVKKITAAYGKIHHPVLPPDQASEEFGIVAAE